MGMGAAALAPFYIISVYIISLTSQLNLPASQGMLLNVCVFLMWMIFIPIIGYFSDRIGLAKMMSFGAILLMIVSIPVFSFVNHDVSLEKILLAQTILSFCGAFYVAPMGAFLATKVFPAFSRYSGMALGISCGEAIFGGTAPLVATALVVLTGDSIAPGFYLMFCGLMGLMGLLAVNYCRPVSSLGDTYSSDKHENIPLMPRLNYKLQ